MAKKKKMGWEFNDQTAVSSAKASIQEISTTKKKPGPKGQDEPIKRVQILLSSHAKLKQLAAISNKKQLEYLSELINREHAKFFD